MKQNLKSELLFVIVLIVFISTYDMPIPRYIATLVLMPKSALNKSWRYIEGELYICRLQGSGILIGRKQF